MNKLKHSQHILGLVLITLLLVGCGGQAAVPPSKPSPEPVTHVGELTWDGTECMVTNLTDLRLGWYSFTLNDQSEDDVHLFVSRIIDGKTFQDLLDTQGEPGVYFPEPDWIDNAVEPNTAQILSDGREVHTYKFISEGEYAVSIWSYATATTPLRVWFCAPFWVKEGSSD